MTLPAATEGVKLFKNFESLQREIITMTMSWSVQCVKKFTYSQNFFFERQPMVLSFFSIQT